MLHSTTTDNVAPPVQNYIRTCKHRSHTGFLTNRPSAAIGTVIAMVAGQFLAPGEVFAQEKKSPVSFTKIQDLSPDTKPLNRPIRQKWAIVIAVGKFKDKRMNNDQFIDKAAKKFHSYLLSEKGGRFQPDHVKLLLNDDATQQNIATSLSPSWLGTLAGPDDLVVVYIATQGFPTTDGNSWLCSYNTALDNIYGTCVSMQSIMKTLKDQVKSDRVVLILESPYSGSANLLGARELTSNYSLDLNKVVLGHGYMLLCSAKPDQAIRGTRFSENLTVALLQNDGKISLPDAFEKAKENTQTDALNEGRKQTPVLKSDWSGADLTLGAPVLEQLAMLPESVRNFLGAESHYLKASRLMGAGDLTAAISEYEAAVATDPSYSDALADYGVALALQGKWKDAVQQLKQAVTLKPNDSLYRANYARVLDALGQTVECRRELEKAYNLNPKDRVILCALADKTISAGDVHSAIGLLQDALDMYPNMASLHDRLGFALSASGNFNDAYQHIEKAVQLDPALVSARLNMGSLLATKGDLQPAIVQYREAIKLAPSNVDAHMLLSKVLEKTSDVAEARDELVKFIELLPAGDARRAAAQAHLDQINASTP